MVHPFTANATKERLLEWSALSNKDTIGFSQTPYHQSLDNFLSMCMLDADAISRMCIHFIVGCRPVADYAV
jgi:hypothetical protein